MNPNSGVRMQVDRPNQEDPDGLRNPDRYCFKFVFKQKTRSLVTLKGKERVLFILL